MHHSASEYEDKTKFYIEIVTEPIYAQNIF